MTLIIDGWITNTVDAFEWIDGHGKKLALRLTGWRITGKEKEGFNIEGYSSRTVIWREEGTKIELLARGKPSPDAFAIYEYLRAEDP